MVLVPYLAHYNTLLQNVADNITKCDKSLLQNTSGPLLQNAIVIAKFKYLKKVQTGCWSAKHFH